MRPVSCWPRARMIGAKARGTDLTQADLTDADLTDADLAGAEMSTARFDGAIGAAVTVFHARASAHWATGLVLARIADDRGIEEYAQDVQPLVERTIDAGMPVSAPRSSLPPPPISWA